MYLEARSSAYQFHLPQILISLHLILPYLSCCYSCIICYANFISLSYWTIYFFCCLLSAHSFLSFIWLSLVYPFSTGSFPGLIGFLLCPLFFNRLFWYLCLFCSHASNPLFIYRFPVSLLIYWFLFFICWFPLIHILSCIPLSTIFRSLCCWEDSAPTYIFVCRLHTFNYSL